MRFGNNGYFLEPSKWRKSILGALWGSGLGVGEGLITKVRIAPLVGPILFAKGRTRRSFLLIKAALVFCLGDLRVGGGGDPSVLGAVEVGAPASWQRPKANPRRRGPRPPVARGPLLFFSGQIGLGLPQSKALSRPSRSSGLLGVGAPHQAYQAEGRFPSSGPWPVLLRPPLPSPGQIKMGVGRMRIVLSPQ